MAKPLRFLVVDDSSTMRRIIGNLLQECGFNAVEEAPHGVAALQKLRGDKFDFVVSDINLPGMNGFELLAEIKKDATLRNTPVLMVAAQARRQDILQATALGAAGYVVKPFTKTILQDKVLVILRKHGLAQQ